MSYWAVGIVKIDFGSGGLGVLTACVEVRGLRVTASGVIDGQRLIWPPVTVGSFIE